MTKHERPNADDQEPQLAAAEWGQQYRVFDQEQVAELGAALGSLAEYDPVGLDRMLDIEEEGVEGFPRLIRGIRLPDGTQVHLQVTMPSIMGLKILGEGGMRRAAPWGAPIIAGFTPGGRLEVKHFPLQLDIEWQKVVSVPEPSFAATISAAGKEVHLLTKSIYIPGEDEIGEGGEQIGELHAELSSGESTPIILIPGTAEFVEGLHVSFSQ